MLENLVILHQKLTLVKVPNVQGDEVQKAEDSVNAQSLKPITIGNGKQIKQQSVKSGTKVLPHSKVMLMTDGN